MLPDERMVRTASGISIALDVPTGTKRLTLHVWNRFGEEIGSVLDEVHPASGARVFAWDGVDSRGRAIPPETTSCG